ncbi:MAG: outer-membrane lipoprotein carrier protein LolA [Holosporaceae bacterium]|jgi:outer membrane lipoprotein-sorting protein|nr:outer-membrane lipoprotein carrier protein LolA [Holosporaceae bacterium]
MSSLFKVNFSKKDYLKILIVMPMIRLLFPVDVQSQALAVCSTAAILDRVQLNTYITLIEKYLNAISTITAEFEQCDSRGFISNGYFFMKRIGGVFALKMDCKSSNGKVVLIKNDKVTYYNRELREKTETAIYTSPLAFLLDKKIDLHRNTKILSAMEENGRIIITFCQAFGDSDGAIKLVFQKEQLLAKEPAAIEQWVIFKNKSDLNDSIMITLKNQKYSTVANEEFDRYY